MTFRITRFMIGLWLMVSLAGANTEVWGQTVTGAEYFFDQDPGIGNGESLSVTAGQPLELTSEISTNGLSAGVHTLFIRVVDSNGRWSLMEGRTFLVKETPVTVTSTLSQAEYFFDQDPGVGKGKNLEAADYRQIDKELDLAAEGLSPGVHTLFIRVKDSSGKWSIQESRRFMINQSLTGLAQIVAAEYYFDNDTPAPGNGSVLPVTPATSLEMAAAIDIMNLPPGKHQLHVRVKDSKGNWSESAVKEFTVEPSALTVVTSAASDITATSAIFHGVVNPNEKTATVTFEYSIDESYGTAIDAVPLTVTGNTDKAVTAQVAGLLPLTIYNFRVKVTTPESTLYGGKQTFVTLQETIAPTAVLSPADNTTDVDIFADLTLTFIEPVQIGTGNIIIKQGSDTHSIIDVNANEVTLSDENTKVTINPARDFDFNADISVEIAEGVFKDTAGNSYAGTTVTTWNFTTLPPITIEKGFATVAETATIAETAVKVNYPVDAIKEVKIHSKDITRNNWREFKLDQDPVNLARFSGNLPLPTTLKDEIGLEYYFQVITTSGQEVNSETALVNVTYNSPGLSFPELESGSEKKDYHIVSVPLNLTNKTVESVFGNLMPYNREKWRLFSYENGSLTEFTKGLTEIVPGKAYLLIMKDKTAINTGAGSTLRQNDASPFTITLKKGWNLIGNPYNLNLSWEEIEEANGKLKDELNLPGIGNIVVFNKEKGYEESGRLNKFSGGFVNCDCTAGDVTLKIPVRRNTTINSARIAAQEESPRNYADSEFESNFTLRTKELSYTLAGIGMHPKAKAERDDFDRVGLPKILHYMQVNFAHPEHFSGNFTKDIVPIGESKIWEFAVETNLEAQEAELHWENYFQNASNKQLFLYDTEAEKIIDMKGLSYYKFYLSKERKFKVYYGDAGFIRENLKPERISVLANTPNPFSEYTRISFALPQSLNNYQVDVLIFDINGKQVAQLGGKTYESGFYQLEWDGTNGFGKRLPSGVYIARTHINSSRVSQAYTLKMILQ